MSSIREQVLDQLLASLTAALPGATVRRNGEKPSRMNEAGGNVILRDGDPGPPEVFMSPLTYTYNHRATLDIAAYESATKTRTQALDDMLLILDGMVSANRTLGGLCEWIEPEAPVTDDGQVDGTDVFRWAEVGLILVYSTTSPLA
jgi:hypothetical protein